MLSSNTLLRRATIGLAAVATLTALCLAIVVARSWKASRKAGNEMRTVFRAETPLMYQADKREQQRDAVLRKHLTQISNEEQATAKPADILRRLPAAFPLLPHPLSVSLATSTAGQDASEPPALITIPQADLKALFDALEGCRACEVKLAAAQQDLDDERAKVSALTIERNAAVKAARGGAFWSRFRSGIKWFAIGGALGAFAVSSARH